MFSHPRATTRPLAVGQLRGRQLQFEAEAEADRQRLILLIYGQHASLERIFGVAEYLSRYGRVIVPDLPGFGGMTPLQAAGQPPSLDNYAKYLGRFIDQEIKPDRPVIVIGMSFGFWVITRLLQLEPGRAGRFPIVVSLVGFASGQALKFSWFKRTSFRLGLLAVHRRPGAWLFRRICLSPWVLRLAYARTPFWRSKLAAGQSADRRTLIDFEVRLWQLNDTLTWAVTARQMINGNLFGWPKVTTPLLHIATDQDQYVDPDQNRIDLAVVYSKVETVTVAAPAHAPPVIAGADQVAEIVPSDLGDRLRRF